MTVIRGHTVAGAYVGATESDHTKKKQAGGCGVSIGALTPFRAVTVVSGVRELGVEILPRDRFRNRCEIDNLRSVGAQFLANRVQATDQVKRDILVLDEMLNWFVEVTIASR